MVSGHCPRQRSLLDCWRFASTLFLIFRRTVAFQCHLPAKPHIAGLGDKKIVKDEHGEHTEIVGAGGWGGGVRLAKSDQDTQDMNRVNLDRFLRKQRRLKEKREREAAQLQETDT
jgi:hypothetical protein